MTPVIATPAGYLVAPALGAGVESAVAEVRPGQRYQLRTDAQLALPSGAVLYPLMYVSDGGSGRLPPGRATPFSRVAPLEVTSETGLLCFIGDISAQVWVSLVTTWTPVDERTPGGCGCAKCDAAKVR